MELDFGDVMWYLCRANGKKNNHVERNEKMYIQREGRTQR